MGDRGAIAFATNGDCKEFVVLYTHSEGSNLPILAFQGIVYAKPRWGDPSYATRMALTKLIGEVSGELGWGVSTRLNFDLEHPTIVVDFANERLALVPLGLYEMQAVTEYLEQAEWIEFGAIYGKLAQRWEAAEAVPA